MTPPIKNQAESFILRMQIGPDCWEWMGARGPTGYGVYSWRQHGRVNGTPAHRKSYELFVGPIQPGLEIDHLCSNRACVRPSHLEAVTHLENVWRTQDRRAGEIASIDERRSSAVVGGWR